VSFQINLSFAVDDKVRSIGAVGAGQMIPADSKGEIVAITIDRDGVAYEVLDTSTGEVLTCAPEDLVSDS